MELRHYYHLYADGEWKTPVTEHFAALVESGLADELECIRIGVVGAPSRREAALSFLSKHSPVPVHIVDQQETGWEHVTMNVMYADCAEAPFYCLYAHTKGAANFYEIQGVWREAMTYWNVIRWRDAVAALEGGSSACGIIWRQVDDTGGPDKRWYYGGNFFWVDSLAVREVEPPDPTSRYEAEAWIANVADAGYQTTCLWNVDRDNITFTNLGEYRQGDRW